MPAGRSPHEHHAPFPKGDVLPAARMECAESPVRTPERREVDATTVNPRTPFRLRPQLFDLARQVEGAVPDEETLDSRNSPALASLGDRGDRVADVEELEVGGRGRTRREPHVSDWIARPKSACCCADGCRSENGCDDDGHRRSTYHRESVSAKALPVKPSCGHPGLCARCHAAMGASRSVSGQDAPSHFSKRHLFARWVLRVDPAYAVKSVPVCRNVNRARRARRMAA